MIQTTKIRLILILLSASLLWLNIGAVRSQSQTAVNQSPISVEGILVPIQSASLSFPVNGMVADILVQEGESVQKGQPLVRLDMRQWDQTVLQAEADVATANNQYQTAQAQLAIAEAGVLLAELKVSAAEANYALLTSDPLTQTVVSAESGVLAANAALNAAIANRTATLEIATPARINQAQAEVAEAIAVLDLLQDQYDDLIANNILGAPEESLRAQVQIAELNRQAKQTALDELLLGADSVQQRLANVAVITAEAQLAQAQAQRDLLLTPPSQTTLNMALNEIEQAEIEVAQALFAITQAQAVINQTELAVAEAETAVALAEANRNQATLVAPFDGTIAELPLTIGTVIIAHTSIGQIADFSQWQVETSDLTEQDIPHVQEGDTVLVQVDALPEQKITGLVDYIALSSQNRQGDVTYRSIIQLEPTNGTSLRWGMTVFIEIE